MSTFMPGLLLVAALACLTVGCSKRSVLSAAMIHGKPVVEADLPGMTKLIETSRSRLALWSESVPNDTISIEIDHPKLGSQRYYYSPSKKALLWLDDPKGRKYGCTISGHSALAIENAFKHSE